MKEINPNQIRAEAFTWDILSLGGVFELMEFLGDNSENPNRQFYSLSFNQRFDVPWDKKNPGWQWSPVMEALSNLVDHKTPAFECEEGEFSLADGKKISALRYFMSGPTYIYPTGDLDFSARVSVGVGDLKRQGQH